MSFYKPLSKNISNNQHRNEGVRFLQSLLGDTRRRLAIMLHWHERAPLKGNSLSEVWKEFVSALMYQKLDFCIDTTGLYLFGTHLSVSKAFFIPFSWLTLEEKATVQHMIAERQYFFNNKEKIYHSGRMMLSGFVGNGHKKAFSAYARKRILRDFCALVYQMTPPLRLPLALILQDMSIERVDVFCMLLSKSLIGYTPDGPSLTPIK